MKSLAVHCSLVAGASLLLGSLARAENYQAVVHPIPPGYRAIFGNGAGDNGMITGGFYREGMNRGAGYTTATGFRELHPTTYTDSWIEDSWGGTYHAGWVRLSPTSIHAFFWVGGSPQGIDLHPDDPVFESSFALGVAGQLQAGWLGGFHFCPECNTGVWQHAARWSRTKASMVRLHAPSNPYHNATCTDGTNVGGWAGLDPTHAHAAVWSGNGTGAPTYLHPNNYQESRVLGISGAQQGGYTLGILSGWAEHATIWAGTKESFKDLHPTPFIQSRIVGVRDGLQVGHGRVSNGRDQAIAWHGSAATWINLHSRLPIQYQGMDSYATDIDNQGNIVGYIESTGPGPYDHYIAQAVIWKRLP
jgi:hypothetical protein